MMAEWSVGQMAIVQSSEIKLKLDKKGTVCIIDAKTCQNDVKTVACLKFITLILGKFNLRQLVSDDQLD